MAWPVPRGTSYRAAGLPAAARKNPAAGVPGRRGGDLRSLVPGAPASLPRRKRGPVFWDPPSCRQTAWDPKWSQKLPPPLFFPRRVFFPAVSPPASRSQVPVARPRNGFEASVFPACRGAPRINMDETPLRLSHAGGMRRVAAKDAEGRSGGRWDRYRDGRVVTPLAPPRSFLKRRSRRGACSSRCFGTREVPRSQHAAELRAAPLAGRALVSRRRRAGLVAASSRMPRAVAGAASTRSGRRIEISPLCPLGASILPRSLSHR